MKIISGVYAAAGLAVALVAAPSFARDFRPGMDVDGNGSLSAREFVVAMATVDLTRYDANKDGVMSIAEFTANDSKWNKDLAKRFNKDNNDTFSPAELVEVYSFIFAGRDKDGNGELATEEAPGQLLKAEASK